MRGEPYAQARTHRSGMRASRASLYPPAIARLKRSEGVTQGAARSRLSPWVPPPYVRPTAYMPHVQPSRLAPLPGRPWKNGPHEAATGTLRDERSDPESFSALRDTPALIEEW